MMAKLLDNPEEARDIGIPETVICCPGFKVWPATTNCEAELAVYVEPSKVSSAGA